MNAAQLLATYGITVDDARQWIVAHLETPKDIYDVAKAGGLTSDMIAEILDPLAPGLTGAMVEGFFTANGFDGAALRPAQPTQPEVEGEVLLPEALASLGFLVGMNQNGGELSTAALRSAALAQLDDPSLYNELFNPANYYGAEDGVFTGAEIGAPGLAGFAATSENLESLFYGTVIRMLQSVDANEVNELLQFAQANEAALESGSQVAAEQLLNLLISVFEDPAGTPMLDTAQLSEAASQAAAMAAELVGTGGGGLFDGAFGNLLG
jgi:hypothetical protein